MDGPLAFGHSVKNKNHLLAFSNILTFAVAGTGNSQLKQYINNFDPKCISDFPCLPDLSILVMPGQHDHDDFNCGPTFEACYKQHCLTVVTAIGELNFSRYGLMISISETTALQHGALQRSPPKERSKRVLQKSSQKVLSKQALQKSSPKELYKGSLGRGP